MRGHSGWFRESYRHYLASKGVKTSHSVAAWQKKHKNLVKDFPGDNPHITDKYARFRQKSPDDFVSGSFRTKDVGDGKKLILGKNKETGKYELQSVMIDKKYFYIKGPEGPHSFFMGDRPIPSKEAVNKALALRQEAAVLTDRLADVEFDMFGEKNSVRRAELNEQARRLHNLVASKMEEIDSLGVKSADMLPDWLIIPEKMNWKDVDADADEFIQFMIDIKTGSKEPVAVSSNKLILANHDKIRDMYGIEVKPLQKFFEEEAEREEQEQKNKIRSGRGEHLFARKRAVTAEEKEFKMETEFLKGGYGDGLTDDMFDKKELMRGTKHEMEHTNDKKIAREIAKDHLAEDPKYYKKLKVMEETRKRYERRAREYAPTSAIKFSRAELVKRKALQRKIRKPVFS